MNEKTMKMFTDSGRVLQVEYAYKAASTYGQTSIAIRGKDSVVVCTEHKVPDGLIVAESVKHVFNVADDIGAVIVGNEQDARFVVSQLRQMAANFKHKWAYEIPVHVLASHLAE